MVKTPYEPHPMPPQQIWTVGHSNRQLADFLDLLDAHGIELVADVRRFPGSRRQPQFSAETFEVALADAGIAYRHFPDLGGRRRGRLPDSPNGGWRVESFNAYADYTLSEEFHHALDQLQQTATTHHTALMCSEAVPWRCHRRLIADALTQQGWQVLDIFTATSAKEHRMTDFAQVVEGKIVYPG